AELVLTNALRCATSSLHPFSEEEQKNHLCRHWSSVDPRNRPPAAVEALAAEMVAALHGAAGRGQRSLLDVPLHAQMAAEAYATQAAQALGTGVSLLPQSGFSLYQLYRRFVERKRDLYERGFGLKDANFDNLPFADNFEEIHQNCAMLILIMDIILKKEKGRCVDIRFGMKETPIMIATECGHKNTVHILLKYGADVAKKDFWKRQALHYAASGGNIAITKLLLDSKADPNARDNEGVTPLMRAAKSGDAQSTELLLERGADVNLKDVRNNTALRY
ncbi:uncharacterized protein GBIM_15357, partial [Gryllus bimaculatus]